MSHGLSKLSLHMRCGRYTVLKGLIPSTGKSNKFWNHIVPLNEPVLKRRRKLNSITLLVFVTLYARGEIIPR